MADNSSETDKKAAKPGCLGIVFMAIGGLTILGILVVVIAGAIGRALETEEEKAQREVREAEQRAEWAAERERKKAEEDALELALRCVEAADKPTNPTGPWSCQFCFSPNIDAAIKARLRASSSYDGGTLAWGKVPLGFDFIQGFTAQNVYGATLDYHAKGTFADKNCKVLSIDIFEGRGF